MKNKKIFYGLICMLFIFVIAGCGYSKEKKEHIEKLKKQGRENAINYIKEKYGFEPKIMSSKTESMADPGGITSHLTGKVFIECEYKSKKFAIYIDGEQKTTDGMDDYQKDEITKDIENYIISKIELKPYKISVEYSTNGKTGMLRKFYTKDNIKEIADDSYIVVTVEYINEKSLRFIKDNNVFYDGLPYTINFINYKSVGDRDISNISLSYSGLEKSLKENALYIKDACVSNGFGNKYYKFNLKQIDDIYYYVEYESNDNIKLEHTKPFEAKNLVGRGTVKDIKSVSKTYKINTTKINGKMKIYIYYPKKYNGKFILGVARDEYYDYNMYDTGKYYVENLSFDNEDVSNFKFAIFEY